MKTLATPTAPAPATPARRSLPSALCLLTSVLLASGLLAITAPLRAALTMTNGQLITISSTDDLNNSNISPLSGITFPVTTGTIAIGPALDFTFDSLGGNTNRLSVTAGRSGAILLGNGSTLTFKGNNNSADGAALVMSATGARLTLDASAGGLFVFTSNTTQQRGAAIAVTGTYSVLTLNRAVISDNRNNTTTNTNHGGAMALMNSATATLTNVLFSSNTAAYGGGAVLINNDRTVLNLNNVSFLNNTAMANNGGAIMINNAASNATINYHVDTGATSQIAGNKANAAGTPNSIFFNNTVSSTLVVDAAAAGSLDMLDPMGGSGAALKASIIKTGSGVWNLGGTSSFTGAGNVDFTITGGTLHLYRAGETSTATFVNGLVNTATAASGGINLATTGGATFTLGAAATLSPGGGNTIQSASIKLDPGATLAFDLAGVPANNAPLLTLNATTAFNTGNWNQNLLLTGLDTTLAASATFTLLTLAGATTGNLLDANSFGGLATHTLPANYALGYSTDQLSLLLLYNYSFVPSGANNVLLWTGATPTAGAGDWSAPNWALSFNGSSTTFTPGDIVNLADTPAPGATTINVDTPVTLAGMYASGTTSHTITGATITSNTTSALAGAGASAQLVLGGSAAPDAATSVATVPCTGTLTLANTANNFTGGIAINAGALVGNAATLGSGTTGITIAPGASLTFSQNTPAPATYTAPITGPAAATLNKTGSATLTLAADNSAFLGTTNITAGKLLLPATATLGGAIHVATAATLGGSGTAATVTLAPAATLQIGDPSATGPQTLTLAALTLDGSILDYTANYKNQLRITGPATLAGGVNTINIATFFSGSTAIIDAAGGWAAPGLNTSLFAVDYNGLTLQPGVNYSLTPDTSNLLWLTLLALPAGMNNVITWTGPAAGAAWHGAPNWTVPTLGLNALFTQGDIVNLSTLPAATAPVTIALATTATASAIYLSGTTSYTITGTAAGGALVTTTGVGNLNGAAGTGKLVLGKTATDKDTTATTAFTGVLDLSGQSPATTNTFAAGIEINSGALRVATTGQLGATLGQITFAGTGTLIAAGNLFLDSSGTTTNRLALTATSRVTLLAENAATVTFNNNNAANAANGAAITATTGATLTLATTTTTAGYAFTNNTATGRAGAIDLSGATATIDRATFSYNTAIGNGGAFAAVALSTATLANVTFDHNTGAIGGALVVDGTSNLTITNATFTANTAPTTGGGAIGLNNGSTLTLANATLAANTTPLTGGAIRMVNVNPATIPTTLTATNVLISGNKADGNGGGIFINNQSLFTLNLTDVSLVNNTSGAAGGALYLNSNSTLLLNYTITPGHVSQIIGNTHAATTGGATPGPNAIYFNSNATVTLNLDIAAGASLDMFDPIMMNANVNLTINKTGPGAWNYGAWNNITGNGDNLKLTIAEGTLHLYGPGEISNGPGGAFTTATAAAANLGGAQTTSFLTISPGAALGAGGLGGATLYSPGLSISEGAILAFDLTCSKPNTPALLTLSSPTPLINNWKQTIALLGLDDLDRSTDATYTLLALNTGNMAATTPLTPASFGNLANVTGLLDGYHLQLSPDGQLLQLTYTPNTTNNTLTWTGAAGNTWYGARNWIAGNSGTTIKAYLPGDIVNLADTIQNPQSKIQNITTPAAGALVAGMYASGTQNYTITGTTAITATTGIGTLASSPAATGKLILGAKATPATLDTAPYTGTLTLANTANNFTAGIEINSGALAGNAATLGVGSAGVPPADEGRPDPRPGILNNGTLIFNQPTNATYPSPITGTGALVKTGPATLTLTAPANPFTGPTTISTGKLLLDHSTLGGDIAISPGATFGGSGTAANVTLATNAALQIGNGIAPGQTLDIPGNLTLANGSILNYSTPASQLHLTGTLNQTGTLTVNLEVFASGSFTLGNIGSLYNNATITVGGAPQFADARQQAILGKSADGVDLTITSFGDISRNMTWTGATGTTWALSGSNWLDTGPAATGTVNVFGGGDRVNFDDTPAAANAPRAITIVPEGVTISDMIVNSASTYTFTGGAITADAASLQAASTIAATGKLTKLNTGTLTLANNAAAPNNFTGGIDLRAGTLLISASTHAGATSTIAPAATLQIHTGARLIADSLELAPASTLATAGAGVGSIQGNITLDGMIAASIAASSTLRLIATETNDNAITGPGAFQKTGPGTLELWGLGALSNTGTTIIDQGTLLIAGPTRTGTGATSTAATILLNTGNLSLAYGTGNANYLTAADWTTGLTILASPGAAASGTITGANDIIHTPSGTLTPQLSGGLHIAVDAGNGVTELGNTKNNFTGAIIVNSGTFRIADAATTGPNTAGATKVALNGGTLEITAPDAPAFRGNIDLHAPAGAISIAPGVSSTWQAITISVPTTGPAGTLAAAIKTGSGTMTLLGNYAGTSLQIDQGRWIAVASTVGTPKTISNGFVGDITINAPGTLELALAPAAGASGTMGWFAGSTPAALYFPTASGNINNAFLGEGTLEITAPARLNLTSPRSDIARLNITGPNTTVSLQGAAFSPAGTITVDAARLILAASAQTLGNITLKNNATMGFLRTGGTAATAAFAPVGSPNKKATIASLSTANENGATPNLWFNTDIGNLTADHLAITGPVTGTFQVNLVDYSTAAPPRFASIELIHAPALTPAATFVVADGSRQIEINNGLKKYLYTVTGATAPGGAYSLNIIGTGTAMSDTAAAIYTAAASIPIAWFAELDSVTQRMGDLHLETRNPQPGTRNPSGLSLWMRGYDERLNFNNKLTGAPFSRNQYGAEAGVDYQAGGDTAKVYLGAYAGCGESYRAHDTPGTSQINTAYAGIYATAATKTGWYAGIVAKFDNIKNQLTITDPATNQNPHAENRNWAMGASLEFGKNQQLSYGWFIEPQAQLAITAISGATCATNTGITIQRLMATAARGRAGFRFGRDFQTAKLGAISAYLKGYYGRQWSADGRLLITPPGGTPDTFDPGITGITLTGGAGLAWQFVKSTQVYFDYEITQARHYIKPYGLNLGIRHCW